MSELTPELNLITAVDDDDTADYLTLDLKSSLGILDGLFNATTGHAHNGAHQGGALEFTDLEVGEDLVVHGTLTVEGSTHLQAGLTVTGTLSSSDLATLNSLDVTTTSRLRGLVTVDSQINLGGASLTPTQFTFAGGANIRVGTAGDIVRIVNHATIDYSLTVGANAQFNGQITSNGQIVTASDLRVGGRAIIGPYDAGPPWYSIKGNVITDTRFYQQGDGSKYCLDIGDASVNTVANKLILRDGQGYLVDPRIAGQVTITSGATTLPSVAAGMWRYVKAWGGNLRIDLTNGTLIVGSVQYTSGQYTLINGESLSLYSEGANWWVM